MIYTIIDSEKITKEITRNLASEKANKKLKIWDRIQMGVFLIGAIPFIFILGILFVDNGLISTFDVLCVVPFFGLLLIGIVLMFILDNKREKLIKKFSETLTSEEKIAEYPRYFEKVINETKAAIAENELDKEFLVSKLQGYQLAKQDLIPET
jgi:hypothetical protein